MRACLVRFVAMLLLCLASNSGNNTHALSSTSRRHRPLLPPTQFVSRRAALLSSATAAAAAWWWPSVSAVHAAPTDCMSDCLKNCNLIAPKDPAYCKENCKSYCDQEDREDGLSGSVSSKGGEVGILGTYSVVKGEDKPPSVKLPGLDFTSEAGRKLIGY